MAKLESLLHDLRVSVVGTDDDPRVDVLIEDGSIIAFRTKLRLTYKAKTD